MALHCTSFLAMYAPSKYGGGVVCVSVSEFSQVALFVSCVRIQTETQNPHDTHLVDILNTTTAINKYSFRLFEMCIGADFSLEGVDFPRQRF